MTMISINIQNTHCIPNFLTKISDCHSNDGHIVTKKLHVGSKILLMNRIDIQRSTVFGLSLAVLVFPHIGGGTVRKR